MVSKLDAKRRVVNAMTAVYEPYAIKNREQSDILWHNISWSEEDQSGFFLVRFAPGGSSTPHEHLGMEEFVVLDGEFEDCDGRVYRTGDCVSLSAGSRHYSHSKEGCTVAVFVRGGFKSVEKHEV
ncbi:MAG: cupin domain-containing protein [Kiloniellales bacterium]